MTATHDIAEQFDLLDPAERLIYADWLEEHSDAPVDRWRVERIRSGRPEDVLAVLWFGGSQDALVLPSTAYRALPLAEMEAVVHFSSGDTRALWLADGVLFGESVSPADPDRRWDLDRVLLQDPAMDRLIPSGFADDYRPVWTLDPAYVRDAANIRPYAGRLDPDAVRAAARSVWVPDCGLEYWLYRDAAHALDALTSAAKPKRS